MRLIEGSRREWYGRPVYIFYEAAGCFLEPPGHPTYKFAFCAGFDRGQGFQEYGSIDFLYERAKQHDLKNILAAVEPLVKFEALPLDNEKTVEWIDSVYAYFKHCYSPDGVDRRADHCIVDHKDEQPPEHHLAVLHIKNYYPDYEPDPERIENPKKWGSRTF